MGWMKATARTIQNRTCQSQLFGDRRQVFNANIVSGYFNCADYQLSIINLYEENFVYHLWDDYNAPNFGFRRGTGLHRDFGIQLGSHISEEKR